MPLIAGSYERFLLGFGISSSQDGASLERQATYPAHKGAIKCLASAGGLLASGGADDLIHLYDILRGRDLGFLMNPGDGAVTALQFFTPAAAACPTHLLNGSADGTITVWAAPSWDCLKTLGGHRSEVTGLAVHPSGRMALSTSRDGELRMWNMAKGKCSYHTKLAAAADGVAFAPPADDASAGSVYALLIGTTVSVHSAEGDGTTLHTLRHEQRALCMAFNGEHTMLTGCEDGSLHVWDTRSGQRTMHLPIAHATRIRSLVVVPDTGPDSHSQQGAAVHGPDATLRVATAASDGVVRLWDMQACRAAIESSRACEPLCEATTSARLTCLTYVEEKTPQVLRATKPANGVKASWKAAKAAPAAETQQHQNGKAGHGVVRPAKRKKVGKAEQRVNTAAEPRWSQAAAVKQHGMAHDGVVDFLEGNDALAAAQKPAKRRALKVARSQPQPLLDKGKPTDRKRARQESLAAQGQAIRKRGAKLRMSVGVAKRRRT